MALPGSVPSTAEEAHSPADALPAALDRALAYLRAQQCSGDHWVGVLSSSALATAMSIVALHLADPTGYRALIDRGRAWLLRTQGADGGWGDAVVDPANINATSLAIGALTYTAPRHPPAEREALEREALEREALARAMACLERFGGWAAVGDPRRCTLSGPCRTVAALAGLMEWRRIKRLRPEVLFLPRRIRRTISTTFPAYLSISSLHAAMAPHPLNYAPTYRRARAGAREWLRQAQGPDGSFEESAFLTSVIITGMIASGQRDLPWLSDAIRFVVESQRGDTPPGPSPADTHPTDTHPTDTHPTDTHPTDTHPADGGWPIDRDLETFDTDLAVFAFYEAGVGVPHADRVRAWLLARQLDEMCFPTGAGPGGWAWAMPAGWPDADDTSYTLLALRALGVPAAAPAVRRGARWLEEMQNSDGSWPTFVRNSSMPFDHDCPYITGHVLCALHAAGRLDPRSTTLRRALAYLARAQRYDGSFASIWFREATAGTASVLEALADCGLIHTPVATRACASLLRSQNDDGGWAGLRRQESTAEETAWALLALLRCPPDAAVSNAIGRGVSWLIERQAADGTWAAAPIGLYYSAMWYSDTYFAVTLPARALARALARVKAGHAAP